MNMRVNFAFMETKLTVQQLEKALKEAGRDKDGLMLHLRMKDRQHYQNWKTRGVPPRLWSTIAAFAGISTEELLGQKPITGTVIHANFRQEIDPQLLVAALEAVDTYFAETKIPVTSRQKATLTKLLVEHFSGSKKSPGPAEYKAKILDISPLFTSKG
jgi:hypothetical protein